MEEKQARYVGIDLGKRTMEVRIIDGEKTRKWNGRTDAVSRRGLYSRLSKHDIVALEACSLAFVIAREIITEVGAEPIVLNPRKLAIIYQTTKKTDSEDAMKLARLVQRYPKEELAVVPLPSEKEQDERALVHEKGFMAEERIRFVNRLHSIFVRQGITTLKKADLSTSKSREKSIKLLEGRCLQEAERCAEVIDIFEQKLGILAEEQREALRDNELTPHVMSVPGVGPDTALAFLAFIGDGSRFTNPGEVSNYIGLVPRVDISGDIVHYGHIIKKHGCTAIRRVLVQAAWALVRSSSGGVLAAKYQELRSRRGGGVAIVAIARRLGELMWTLIRRRDHYWYFNQEKLTKKLKIYKLEKKLEKGRSTA